MDFSGFLNLPKQTFVRVLRFKKDASANATYNTCCANKYADNSNAPRTKTISCLHSKTTCGSQFPKHNPPGAPSNIIKAL